MPIVDVVNIYGIIINALGEAKADVTCLFAPVCNPQFIDNKAIIMETVDATTDSTGYFSIDLIGDARYRVCIDNVGLCNSLVIPTDETSYNLFTLLGA
jgi:hypothetical protein